MVRVREQERGSGFEGCWIGHVGWLGVFVGLDYLLTLTLLVSLI